MFSKLRSIWKQTVVVAPTLEDQEGREEGLVGSLDPIGEVEDWVDLEALNTATLLALQELVRSHARGMCAI